MARDTATAYVVDISTPGYRWTPAAWNCRTMGRPTAANLRRHVEGFEASTRPGGVNAHLGATLVTRASIRRNALGGAVVATYEPPPAPAFAVIAGGENL